MGALKPAWGALDMAGATPVLLALLQASTPKAGCNPVLARCGAEPAAPGWLRVYVGSTGLVPAAIGHPQAGLACASYGRCCPGFLGVAPSQLSQSRLQTSPSRCGSQAAAVGWFEVYVGCSGLGPAAARRFLAGLACTGCTAGLAPAFAAPVPQTAHS